MPGTGIESSTLQAASRTATKPQRSPSHVLKKRSKSHHGTTSKASDAPFGDRREVMEDCGMGRGVRKLKKGPLRETYEKEEETTKGAQDAWSPTSDATPAPAQLGRPSSQERTRHARITRPTRYQLRYRRPDVNKNAAPGSDACEAARETGRSKSRLQLAKRPGLRHLVWWLRRQPSVLKVASPILARRV
jgi:hypothetical protein